MTPVEEKAEESVGTTPRSTSGSSDSSTFVEPKKRWSMIRLQVVEDADCMPCGSTDESSDTEVQSPNREGVYDLSQMLVFRSAVTDTAEEVQNFSAMSHEDVDAVFVAAGLKPLGYEVPSRTQERRRERESRWQLGELNAQRAKQQSRWYAENEQLFKFYDAVEEERWFDCFEDEETMMRILNRGLLRSQKATNGSYVYNKRNWRNQNDSDNASPTGSQESSAVRSLTPTRVSSAYPSYRPSSGLYSEWTEELEPIPPRSENAYVVSRPETRAKGANLLRSVNSLLNKVAPQTLEVLSQEMKELFNKEVETKADMDLVCKQFVRKAMLDVHYIETYAQIAFSTREEVAKEDEERTFADALVEAVEIELVRILPAEDEDAAAHMERVEEKKKRCLGLATFASELLKHTVMDLDVFEEYLVKMMKATFSEIVVEMLIEAVATSGSMLEEEMLEDIVAHLKELQKTSCKRVQFQIRDALEMAKAKFANLCLQRVRLEKQKAKRLSRVKAEADAEYAAVAARDAERSRVAEERRVQREAREAQMAQMDAHLAGMPTWRDSQMAPMANGGSILQMPPLPLQRGHTAPARQSSNGKKTRQSQTHRDRQSTSSTYSHHSPHRSPNRPSTPHRSSQNRPSTPHRSLNKQSSAAGANSSLEAARRGPEARYSGMMSASPQHSQMVRHSSSGSCDSEFARGSTSTPRLNSKQKSPQLPHVASKLAIPGFSASADRDSVCTESTRPSSIYGAESAGYRQSKSWEPRKSQIMEKWVPKPRESSVLLPTLEEH